MFCRKCGEEIIGDVKTCPNCGEETKSEAEVKIEQIKKEQDASKTGLGVTLGLLLGIFGLIIGLCLYKSHTNSRDTFLKGWGIGFGIWIGILVVYNIF